MNAQRIRERMSGDRRRGSLSTLVRTRVGGRTGTRLAPYASLSIYRLSRLVGPQNDDESIEGYDTPWTLSGDIGGALGIVLGSAEAPDIPAGVSPAQWIRRCKPLRYRVGGLPPEWSTEIRARAAEWPGLSIGITDTMVPSDSHCAGLTVSTISLPIPMLIRDDSLIADAGSRISHLRVLRNGVDITGVITLPTSGHGFSVYDIGSGFGSGSFSLTPADIQVDVTPFASAPADVFEVDIWVYAHVSDSSLSAIWPNRAILWALQGHYEHYITRQPRKLWRFDATNANADMPQSTGWLLRIPEDSVWLFGNATRELVIVSQEDWTYSQTPVSRTMIHAGYGVTGRVQEITLRWDREIPEITISTPTIGEPTSGVPLAANRQLRYQPSGTAYDDWAYFRHGLWDRLGTTVFSLQGTLRNNSSPGGSPTWLSAARGLSFMSPYADSITVERV